MKIKVTRTSLVRQLPTLRLEIIRDFDSDEYIYLEGETGESINPLLKDFPKFIDIFTDIQLKYLTEMYSKKAPVNKECLAQFSHNVSDIYQKPSSNIVDVHIKDIRNKLKRYRLPFKIKVYRGKQLRELVRK